MTRTREDGGRRKGGRNNREETAGSAKPSQNVSLFSFLEDKVPALAAESAKPKSAGSQKPYEAPKPQQQPYDRQGQGQAGGRRVGERSDRNSAEKSDRNADSAPAGDRRRRGGGRGYNEAGGPRENGQPEAGLSRRRGGPPDRVDTRFEMD